MIILIINAGSSSVKYQMFRMPETKPLCSGLAERIGVSGKITHKKFQENDQVVVSEELPLQTYEAAMQAITRLLTDEVAGVINSTDEVEVVGHRVVHGGETFARTTIITDEVKAKVQELFALAPLHNPPNYTGIVEAEKIFKNAIHVGVFDTAFHQSMPEKAFRYAIPPDLYYGEKIRVYGFHGTSHLYVSHKAAEIMQNPAAKIVTIHLGNGSSMAAIKHGKSMDTTMGFGPLGGLIMGTRSGDIDPAIIFHLHTEKGYSANQISQLLNKDSGMLGLTGHSDMRDITKMMHEGNESAKLAYEMYAYRIKKYIGSYAAVLNGLDAIVFTAGVGENDARVRELVCEEMEFLGIHLDKEKNALRSSEARDVSQEGAKVRIFIIPTNEELEIAEQCYALIKGES